jgi:2-polyprenyl-3-methyl-5-hydroxy-6-metoxy-1,4-benzoquinol methylase
VSDAEHNIYRFTRLVEAHGTSAQALGWGSVASQRTRFDVLTAIGDLDGCTLADVGAGLGDLYGYLVERGISVGYTGYDLTPAMVEVSRARWPGVCFEVRDILAATNTQEVFDYVVASGIFTFHTTQPMAFLDRMVRQMFAMCRRGVAFNVLSSLTPEPEPGEFVAEPDAVLKVCQAITPYVVLRHDYFQHDFSIYLRRTAT